jgi:hypothetical protein
MPSAVKDEGYANMFSSRYSGRLTASSALAN